MALPWLEVMGDTPVSPAPANAAKPVAAGQVAGPATRMAFLYMPNGVNPHHWAPKGKGKSFELSETMKPLAPHKDDILVLSGLWNRAANTGDGHYVKTGAWLTGTTITKTSGADIRSNGVSVDQMAARAIGNLTPLPSLELGTEPTSTGVDVVVGYTRLYGAHIAWSSPTTPLAKEIDPRLAFDRLFRSRAAVAGKPGDDDRSVLDLVAEDADRLRKELGAADRLKLDEYFESVRAIERRIEFEASTTARARLEDPVRRAEIAKLDARLKERTGPKKGRQGTSADHETHVDLMLDLIVLAFQTDSTRVATFMFGNDVSNRDFAFMPGVTTAHHESSHHENDKKKLEDFKRINTWHMERFARMLGRLRASKEGERTLLDSSMVLIGSPIRDGNAHDPHNLPLVLGGRGNGTLATGRHLEYPRDTPLANLHRGLLRRMGCPVTGFADSTGELKGLDDPAFAG
jgi:hypothetical protein